MSEKYFIASEEIVEFYNKVLNFASYVSYEVGEEYWKSFLKPYTNGALYL
jgi:hypothetical protein